MKSVWEAAKKAFASHRLCCALLAAAMLSLNPAQADNATTSLVIHVANIDAKGGMLRLGLYDAAGYADEKAEPVAAADVRAEPGETVVVLQGLKPGTYAIQAYQDVNANDKMDTTWFGYPLEPFGFSRDARPHLRKPRFAQVEFTLKPGENSQILHLQHSVSLLAAE